MGPNAGPAGKRLGWGCLGPATQGSLERARDSSRKRKEVYVSCPRAVRRAIKGPKIEMYPQGTRELKQVEGRRLNAKQICAF